MLRLIEENQEHIRDTKDEIRELRPRVLDPDHGVIVKVAELTRWRKSVDRALWIIFTVLISGVLGTVLGWFFERAVTSVQAL